MKIVINDKFQGLNVFKFLDKFYLSKKMINKLAVNKLISINDHFENFDYVLQDNDIICFNLNTIEPNNVIPYQGKIEIVHEDEDLLIVNKPPFLLVHSDGNTLDTLANRVSYYAIKKGYEGRITHIHRLDYETSGMVLFAKHFLAYSYLSTLFETREIKKTYLCYCHNRFKNNNGVIDAKIGKDRHENKQRISKTGKDALTKYKVLENGSISKVEVEIVGGRKHQIRVHMASINHPLVGDKIYGHDEEKRLLLHFQEVSFIHPRSCKLVKYICPPEF